MAVSWPAGVESAFLSEGHAIQPSDNILREQMDVGPSKSRRRASAAPVRVNASVALTDDELDDFDTWYHGTLLDGSVAFTHDDEFGTSRDYMMVQPPQYTLRGTIWIVSMTLEYIP